jgi:hypothetical protein
MSLTIAELTRPAMCGATPARQRGDPNLAPRCGAKARTTGSACRAPAMKNGRCRLHGGKSTGPRTAEGLARMAAAHTTHGNYSAEGAPRRAERRHIRIVVARSRVLETAEILEDYLSPEKAAQLAAYPRELRSPKHPSQMAFEAAAMRTPCNLGEGARMTPRWRDVEGAAALAEVERLAPWKAAIALARVAKRAARVEKREARARAAAAKRCGAHIDPIQPSERDVGAGDEPAGERRSASESPLSEMNPMYPAVALRAAGVRAALPSPGSLRDPTLVRYSRPKPASRERCNGGGTGGEFAPRDINPMERMSPGCGPGLETRRRRTPTRLTPTKAEALRSTTLGLTWTLVDLRAHLGKRFPPAPPPNGWHAPQALRPGSAAAFSGVAHINPMNRIPQRSCWPPDACPGGSDSEGG